MFPHAGTHSSPPIWEQAMDDFNSSFDSTQSFFIAFAVAGLICAIIVLIQELDRRA